MSMNRKIGTISKKFFRPYEWIYKFWASWIITKSIYGQNSITLTNAIMNKLIELRAFGWTKQNWTPTPTSPIDILCNNWALKVRKESGLPFRYKKVEYITASWTQWLNTWIKLASTDIVEAEYKNSSSSWYWALYWVFAVWDSSAFYANWTYYWYDVVNNKVNTWVNVDTSRHSVRQDFVNWVITLDGANTTYTPFTFDNNKDNYLFSRYYSNSYWYWFKWSCRKYRIYRWWELICDLIPVIDTQNNDEPWMYDLVSGQFRWNIWTWNFTAWADAQDNIEVYIDWTQEEIWITTTYDTIDWNWTYVTPNSAQTTRVYKGFGQLPAWTYKVSISWNYELIIQYKDVETWVPTQYWNIWTWTTEWTFTADWTNYYWIAIRIPPDGTSAITFNWTISFVENQNTATCEDLFWLWDIKDEQEILSWSIIRKIWIKVLDWTENWITWNGGVRYNFQWDVWSFETTSMLCSHYNYAGANVSITDMSSNQFSANSNWNISFKSAETTSASDFKTRLSDQVSAWTPVFIIYQKQNPTTDTVARQTLDIQTWTNVIEITQASISPLDLFAKYKATE